MRGILYGVGVGPGDPELMTVKAVRIISKADVIAVPTAVKKDALSYRIAAQMVPELDLKECLELPSPMTKDREILDESYEEAAGKIAGYLEDGKDVAFLTIGDPTVYSTFMYVDRAVKALGYETKIISGVTSFCAAAACLGESLGERSEQIHIIPSSYDIEEALELPGNKILMKAASKLGTVKERILERGAECVMVENCGLPDEKVYRGADEIPDSAGYYTTIIVKDKHK